MTPLHLGQQSPSRLPDCQFSAAITACSLHELACHEYRTLTTRSHELHYTNDSENPDHDLHATNTVMYHP
jgi:hypothetical protein